MRVVVIGGGIVGLVTALALKVRGDDVVLCERSPEIRTAGAVIGLWPNALDVLRDLGVGDEVARLGQAMDTWFYDPSGRAIRAEGYGDLEHRMLLVPRIDLSRVLASAVGPLIRFDAPLVSYEEHADHVAARLGDGTSLSADLLVGADGVYSSVRHRMLPGHAARPHLGHYVWRGLLPSGLEPAQSSILTVGPERTRGGFARTADGHVYWMVNQFGSPEPTGSRKEAALARARCLTDGTWNKAILALVEATPEQDILHHQITFVPEIPQWTTERVALIGDAAHGLSPHIGAGGTLGIEDVRVLVGALDRRGSLPAALAAYQANRLRHYACVKTHADAVEAALDAESYAFHYARFTHWMLHAGAADARI